MITPTSKLIIALTLSAAVGLLWRTRPPPPAPQVLLMDTGQVRISSSLDGKAIATYEGNYHIPGDGAKAGWGQWSRDSEDHLTLENISVTLLPDVSEYSPGERRKTKIMKPDGSYVEVFSSINRRTTARHLNWMKKYDIHGVLLKRPASHLRKASLIRPNDKLISNFRELAWKQDRTYFIGYRLEGLPISQTYLIREDWSNLLETERLTVDPSYQWHHGKPLVALSAHGFEQSPTGLTSLLELASFFKTKGCSLLLEVPPEWRTGAASDNWKRIAEHADIISLRTIGLYNTAKDANIFSLTVAAEDQRWCSERDIDYLPLVFPGYRQINQDREATPFIERSHGKFLWAQIDGVKRSKSKMMCIESFDGMRNGTAVLDWDKDALQTPSVDGVTYENLPNNYYLKLVSDGIRLFQIYLEH